MDTIVKRTINETYCPNCIFIQCKRRNELRDYKRVFLNVKCIVNFRFYYNQISISYFSNSNSEGKSVKGFATPDEM